MMFSLPDPNIWWNQTKRRKQGRSVVQSLGLEHQIPRRLSRAKPTGPGGTRGYDPHLTISEPRIISEPRMDSITARDRISSDQPQFYRSQTKRNSEDRFRVYWCRFVVSVRWDPIVHRRPPPPRNPPPPRLAKPRALAERAWEAPPDLLKALLLGADERPAEARGDV